MKITIKFNKPKQFNCDVEGREPDGWITIGGHTEEEKKAAEKEAKESGEEAPIFGRGQRIPIYKNGEGEAEILPEDKPDWWKESKESGKKVKPDKNKPNNNSNNGGENNSGNNTPKKENKKIKKETIDDLNGRIQGISDIYRQKYILSNDETMQNNKVVSDVIEQLKNGFVISDGEEVISFDKDKGFKHEYEELIRNELLNKFSLKTSRYKLIDPNYEVDGIKTIDDAISSDKSISEKTKIIRELSRYGGKEISEQTTIKIGEEIKKQYNEGNYNTTADTSVIDKEIEDVAKKISAVRSERDELYTKYFNMSWGDPESNTIYNQYNKKRLEINKLHRQKAKLEDDKKAQTNKGIMSIISSNRDCGLTNAKVEYSDCFEGRSTKEKIMRDALEFFPSDWIETASKRKVKLSSTTGRAFCGTYSNEISISAKVSDAIHEYAHYIEGTHPNIKNLLNEFLDRRTQGEDAKSLKSLTGRNYSYYEKAKPDNFVNPYMGKIYPDKSTELLSMGMEYAFTQPEKLAKDPEYESLIYGIMSTM